MCGHPQLEIEIKIILCVQPWRLYEAVAASVRSGKYGAAWGAPLAGIIESGAFNFTLLFALLMN